MRDWNTGEGFTNGLTQDDILYLRWAIASERDDAYRRGREDAAKALGALRSSNKKDENGWYLFEHCYECMGAASGYDMAVDDAIATARGVGEQE